MENAKVDIVDLVRAEVRREKKLPQVITVDDLQSRILSAKGRLADKTKAHYRWLFDKVRANRGTWFTETYEVNEFIANLKGINDETALQIFKLIRAVGRYLKRTYGWDDPTENAQRPVVSHKERRYFTETELKLIGEACHTVRDKALILALLDSSARIGEVAGLRVSDFGKNTFKTTGKTGKRVYRCKEGILQLMRNCAVDGVVFPVLDASREVVYPVSPVRGNILGQRVNKILKRAGLTGEKLGAHTLRHTAASIVARKSKSALVVKALLQHDDVRTSQRYIHDFDDEIQQDFSPLELSGMTVDGGEIKMLPAGRQFPLAEVDSKKQTDVALIKDLFPRIKKDLAVRPRLNSEDLELIRDGLIELMNVRGELGSGSKSVQLMRRMLRRV
jgi:integrase/recombinase XerD